MLLAQSPSPGPLEFHEQRRILVPREQAEEEPVGKTERAHVPQPPELQEPPILIDGSGLLPPHGTDGPGREQIPAPQAGLLLLARDRQRVLVHENVGPQLHDPLGIACRLRCHFGQGPVLKGETGGLEQPRER